MRLRTVESAFMISIFCLAILIVGLGLAISQSYIESESHHCDCTIDFNGHQVLIEDVIYGILEGLSEDQAQEIWIMINSSADNSESY